MAIQTLSYGKSGNIFSQLLSCSTARGSRMRLSLVGSTKVKAPSLFYSLKVPLKLKIRNTWLILYYILNLLFVLFVKCEKQTEFRNILILFEIMPSLLEYNQAY